MFVCGFVHLSSAGSENRVVTVIRTRTESKSLADGQIVAGSRPNYVAAATADFIPSFPFERLNAGRGLWAMATQRRRRIVVRRAEAKDQVASVGELERTTLLPES